jgi:hypothetical protein
VRFGRISASPILLIGLMHGEAAVTGRAGPRDARGRRRRDRPASREAADYAVLIRPTGSSRDPKDGAHMLQGLLQAGYLPSRPVAHVFGERATEGRPIVL